MSLKVINVNTSKKHATVLVVISSILCDYPQSFSRQTIQEQNNNYFLGNLGGISLWQPRAQAFLRVSGRDLDCSNLHSMAKISYAGCLDLSPAFSAQFNSEMCVATQNREKFTKTPYFWGSGSFKVIDVNIFKKLVASGCYNKQHVCALSLIHIWRCRRRG